MSDSRPLLHLNRHDLAQLANSGDAEALAEWQARETGGGLDLTAYTPEAVKHSEKLIRDELARGFIKTRREAAALHMKAWAQVISDDVLLGVPPHESALAEYRYLRDLTAHLYGLAEASLGRIDGPARAGR